MEYITRYKLGMKHHMGTDCLKHIQHGRFDFMCIFHLLNSVSGHILFSDMFPQYKYAIGAGATELLHRKSLSPKPENDS